jgi:general secretion pathway protein D
MIEQDLSIGIRDWLLAIFATVAALPAWGQISAVDDAKFVINLRDADIRALSEQVSDITGRTLILDPAVTGQVTVISTESLDEDGVWDLFQSVLRVQGFAALRSGDIWRVIPQESVREAGGDLTDDPDAGRLDVITRLVQLENFPVATAVAALRPLVAGCGYIEALPESNTLVITDTSENVERIEAIARTLDEGDGSQVSTVPVRNADAMEISDVLRSVLGAEASGLSPRVAIDARGNILLVRGSAEMVDNVRQIVTELDQPARQSPSLALATRVYRLSHADAASMVEILRGVIGGQAGVTSAVVESLGPRPYLPSDVNIANGFGAADPIEAGGTVSELTFGPPPVSSLAAEDITIQAAANINAVVIRARAEVQADLGQLIAQLDQRRPQVLIEAAIVEISGDVAEELGVQFGFGNAAPEGGFASTSFNNSGRSLASILTILGLPVAPAVTAGLTIGLSEEDKYGILIQALGQSTKANLLSTPSITTLDNQPASILVGQNVPFRTGTFATDGTGSDPFTTIERQDVGITLSVTPRINQGDVVQLDVIQEVSSISNAVVRDAADIITNRRLIQTSVLADNGGTIVLGGLISDDRASSRSEVPGLGDLPIVGRLFGSNSENSNKRVLFVFLRPSILRNRADVNTVSANRFQRLRSIEVQPGNPTSLLRETKPVRRLPVEINGLY